MHIPEFWVRVSDQQEDRDGRRQTLYAWGWSDEGQAEARSRAQQSLAKLRQRIHSKQPLDSGKDYYASDRPLRERILERGPAGSDKTTVLVTRNRLGNRILNCRDIWIIDVDLPHASSGLFGFFARQRRARQREKSLSQLRRWADGGRRLRIWDTAGGLRALRLDARIPVNEGLTELKQLGADPRYADLCQAQQSYRARLDPKPWRLGIGRPPQVIDDQLPRDDQGAMADWLRLYQRAASTHATCQFLEDAGSAAADPRILALAQWHDAQTGAGRREQALA
ncbi:MAG: hypothetical protein EA402_12220 [Planctomycetota bacterium]|nr:MAG: hypothetical protein EA402_12220 [Planctomycetota bacterium]